MARVVPEWVRRRAGQKSTTKSGLKHGFRSGLEDQVGKQIAAHGFPVLYESFKLPYIVPEKRHFYTHDFILPNHIIVETKGIFDAPDRAKHLFIKAQYPELDIRFVFTRSKAGIAKGSKTTLAMWCIRYGFKYSDKLIPPEWFTEPAGRDPREILREGPYGYVSRSPVPPR